MSEKEIFLIIGGLAVAYYFYQKQAANTAALAAAFQQGTSNRPAGPLDAWQNSFSGLLSAPGNNISSGTPAMSQ